ncbi:MAG: rubredoxin [Phycisphaerae bacterium]|jgi:hypothetical protein
MNKKWKCACGYIHDGIEAPIECPRCGAAADKFTLLDDKASELVERSRHTNALHCRMVGLTRRIEKLCKDGIEDNLDAGCVNVFEKCLERAYEMMKMSMAEMQGHIAKGKWS